MATIYPVVCLCVFPKQMRYRANVVSGICMGRNGDHVVVTGHQNTVSVYKVDDRQPIKCWTTKQKYNFKTVARYDPFSKIYIIVVNNQVIRTWTEEDSNLEYGNKIKASSAIREIFTSQHSEPLILYEDGNLGFLDVATAGEELSKQEPKTDKIFTADDIIIDTVAAFDQKQPMLVIISKNPKENVVNFHCYLLRNGEKSYEHCDRDCSQKPETFSCCAFYQSKRGLFALVLELNGDLHRYVFTAADNTVTVSYDSVMRLNLTVQPSTFMQVLTETHMTLVYPSEQTISGTFNIVSYDIRFKLQHSSSTFENNGPAKLIQLKRIGRMLYVLTDKDIVSIPFEARESTLSDVLGTGTTDDFRIDKRNVQWAHDGVIYNEKRKLKDTGCSKELLKHTFKYEDEGLSEFQVCVKTLQEVQSKGNLTLMLETLSFFKNIPEFVLVNCLQCYLSKLLEEGNPSEHRDKNIPFIDEIVSKCVDTVFLIENLRKLPFAEVEFLLQYLQHLLGSHCDLLESSKPTAVQLVDWICALLDAHFQSLTLSMDPTVHKLLSDLATIVHEKCDFLSSLSGLEELLVVMEKWHHIPARKVQAYSIETVFLN